MNALAIEIAAVAVFVSFSVYSQTQTKKREAEAEVVRVKYLENNLPYLKDSRDQVTYQLRVCDKNIEKLQQMLLSFKEPEAKSMVNKKMDDIKIERRNLEGLLSKINTELEKGLFNSQVNHIDEGGLRRKELQQLAEETAITVNQAKKANAFMKESQKF